MKCANKNIVKENNMEVQTRKHTYTPEEYLELEEKALYKSEYRNGEIIPMTGGTTNHNQIALNFASSLLYAIRGKKYRVFIGDVRLWIPEYREYTYPDVIVTDGKPLYAGKNNTTVTNPLLIVEVLSKSTKNYDQGDKFTFYRSIPQFKEYVLVEQNQYQVMHYSKTNKGEWIFREYKSEDDIVKLQHLDFEISLVDIYQDVNFDDKE
jgi:Uma2 family endonuclease